MSRDKKGILSSMRLENPPKILKIYCHSGISFTVDTLIGEHYRYAFCAQSIEEVDAFLRGFYAAKGITVTQSASVIADDKARIVATE